MIKKILKRLNKFKYIILLGGILMAVSMYLYAKKIPIIYSAKSTVFPLTASADNNSAASKITELMGGNKGGKTISEEANVNIEEVGRSKKTREAVVGERLPEFENKKIAQILVDKYNSNRNILSSPKFVANNEEELIRKGAEILKDLYTIKFNKNNLLEIIFTNDDKKLVSPVNYKLVDKISKFYIELKIEKAKQDYDFTDKKLDSLENVLNNFDAQRVHLNKTTLFVPKDRMQYSIPKENLEADKIRITLQRNSAAANKEDALYRLGKATPIIKILDTPTEPYDTVAPSKIIYALGGFLLGLILFSILFIVGLVYKYANQQINETIALQLSDTPKKESSN